MVILILQNIFECRYFIFPGKNDTADKEVRILTGKSNTAELGSIVSYDNRTRLDSWWEKVSEDTEDTEDAEIEDSEDEAGQCNSIRGTDGSVFPPLVTKDQVRDPSDLNNHPSTSFHPSGQNNRNNDPSV